MKPSHVTRYLLISIVLLCNIGCDQISKSIVRSEIRNAQQIRFLDNHLTLTKVENTGAFLSLGHDLPLVLRIALLNLLPIVILIIALVYVLANKTNSVLRIVAICFIIGGGVGNLYDRIVHGSVTDFLHIDFGVFETGIFNMADVSIMIGMMFVLFEMFFKERKLSEG
jgi:signal peptidase II